MPQPVESSDSCKLHNICCCFCITQPGCSHCQEAVHLHSFLLQPSACSLRPGRLLVHWQGTSALAHLRTGDPSQMEEAAPKGLHALSFASLAHKSFIKDVSFAYTEGRQMPHRTWMKYRYKRLLPAVLGLCVCSLVGERATFIIIL